ncbi:hypothetical protein D9M68_607600 [compost metagenome]
MASASASFSGGLGRRTCLSWTTMGAPLVSARAMVPCTGALSRARLQPLAVRLRLVLRFSRFIPKPLKRPISTSALRSSRAFSAPSLGI